MQSYLQSNEGLEAKTARFNEIMAILNPKEEQTIGESDDEQYSGRYEDEADPNDLSFDIRNDIYYPKKSRDAHAFLRSFADQSAILPEGKPKDIIVFTADDIYFCTATGYLEGEINKRIPINGREESVNEIREEFKRVKQRRQAINSLSGTAQSEFRGSRGDNVGIGDEGAEKATDTLAGEQSESESFGYYSENFGYDTYEDLIEALKGGAVIFGEDGTVLGLDFDENDEQAQERTSPLTDREVLYIAANSIKLDGLTDAEKDAHGIFKQRIEYLHMLARADAGTEYKEQQFGAHVDREAAKKTLERMHTPDNRIKAASDSLLKAENTEILRKILSKARKVVESTERAKANEQLKRYRDQRNNAAGHQEVP